MMQWLIKNFGISIAMALATTIASGLYVSMEIDALGYRALSNMYTQGTDRFRASLNKKAVGKKISVWEYRALAQDFWVDGKALTMPVTPAADLETSRADFYKFAGLSAK